MNLIGPSPLFAVVLSLSSQAQLNTVRVDKPTEKPTTALVTMVGDQPSVVLGNVTEGSATHLKGELRQDLAIVRGEVSTQQLRAIGQVSDKYGRGDAELADEVRKKDKQIDAIEAELEKLATQYPQVIKSVRGLGFMLGIELAENIPAFANTGKVASLNFVNRLHDAGVLTVPSGAQVVRFLPALNLTRAEAGEGLTLLTNLVRSLA
mgnify:CR=1 FL=1